ncbi:MAG: hypothetical protein ACRELA_24445 [Candidatus Rokuibacteriota bacterium]
MWDEALDTVARELLRMRAQYGNPAICVSSPATPSTISTPSRTRAPLASPRRRMPSPSPSRSAIRSATRSRRPRERSRSTP